MSLLQDAKWAQPESVSKGSFTSTFDQYQVHLQDVLLTNNAKDVSLSANKLEPMKQIKYQAQRPLLDVF
jgi:hypothetical protein